MNWPWKKDIPLDDPARSAIIQGYASAESQKSGPDIEFAQSQGANMFLVGYEPVDRIDQSACYNWQILTDDKGQPVLDEQGNPKLYPAGINFDNVALLRLNAPQTGLSFISQRDMRLMQLYFEAVLLNIEDEMNEDEILQGRFNNLDSIRAAIRLKLCNSLDGKMAKLLKTVPKITTFTLETQQGKKA